MFISSLFSQTISVQYAPYLVDVLALELGDELVETIGISLNADGVQDALEIISLVGSEAISCSTMRSHLDVLGGRGGVSTEAEEEVCREVLHCGCWLVDGGGKNRSSIDLTCAD